MSKMEHEKPLNQLQNPQQYISEAKSKAKEHYFFVETKPNRDDLVNFTAGRFIDLLLKNFNYVHVMNPVLPGLNVGAEVRDPKLRIAYILPHLKLYGGVRRAIEVCNKFVEFGHDVTVFTLDGIPCEWMETKFTIRPHREITKELYDVGVFTLETDYKLMDVLRASRKFYWILHYGVLYKDPISCRAGYRGNYELLANSKWTAEQIEKDCGRKPKLITSGINHALFNPCINSVPDHPVVIGYGSERIWKGRRDLEESFLIVKEKYPKAELKFLADLNLPQEKMAQEYSNATGFVSTSWYEGWNHMGIEAMACGCPLIITDDGGSRDYTKNGVNCIVVKPRAIEDIAKAIIELIEMPKGVIDIMVANGLETAAQYKWEKCANELMETFLGEPVKN